MTNSIKEQIDCLVKLQAIEIETDNIQSMLSNVTERFASLDRELDTFEQGIEDEEALVKVLQKEYRTYDAEVQTNLARVKQSQEKLHSVKNNKEYQSLLKEIEDTKAMNSSIEDKMLECLDRVEMLEDSINVKRDEYSVLSDRIKEEKEIIDKETETGKQRIVELGNERSEIIENLESEVLSMFNNVKTRHGGGIAIVPVMNSVCYGCNVNLPPQMYNELQRFDSLRFCPNCQRIVYWEKV